MPEDQLVTGNKENGILVLTVRFDPDFLFQKEANERISDALREIYEEKWKETGNPSCIIQIEAKMVGSPLVRGLFELWQTASTEGGQVVCVNYPWDYLDSLTSLGLLDLGGFHLADSKEEAIRVLTP